MILNAFKRAAMLLPLTYASAPAFAQEPVRWSGFYAGINGGYGLRTDRGAIAGDVQTGLGGQGNFIVNNAFNGINYLNAPAVAPLSLDERGAIGGAQAGYNLMLSSRWLVGVEFDLQKTSIKSESTADSATGLNRVSVTSSASLEWFATARGRIGFLVNRDFMIFGTAGWAYGQTSLSTDVDNRGGNLAFGGVTALFCAPGQRCMSAAETQKVVGVVFGGGAEWALLPSVTLRAEYMHLDLGSQTITARRADFGGIPGAFVTSSVNNAFDVVRAALNYRF